MSTTVVRSSAFIVTRGVNLSEDAWEGDAEFTVEVKGSISGNGVPPANTNAVFDSDSTDTCAVGATASAPANRLTGHLSEDVWEGKTEFSIDIDGEAVTMRREVKPTARCQRRPKLHLHD